MKKVELTRAEQLYKERLTKAVAEKRAASKRVHSLMEKCKHRISFTHPDDGAVCVVCDSYFGWQCKDSPDGVCHYYSWNGEVELIDGSKHILPEGYDNEYETEDDCIFCHEPNERK